MLIEIHIFSLKIVFEKVVCEMAAILSQPECVKQIIARAKWPSFWRQVLQIHFLAWECDVLIQISLEYVLKGLADK